MNSDAALEELVARYLDDRLDAPGGERLRGVLSEDAEARAYFRHMIDLHAAMAGDASLAGEVLAAGDRMASLSSSARPRIVIFSRPVVLAVAACLVLGLVALWLIADRAGEPVVLTRAVGASFAGKALFPGKEPGTGEVSLQEGFVELRFASCEALVVIEAPAIFRVINERTLRLDKGRLTAHVRDGATGLHVLTPHSDVIDLGTRFAVDVLEARGSEVHVFEGNVTADDRLSNTRDLATLETGDAVRIGVSGGIAARELRHATFVQGGELDALSAGLEAHQADQWRAAIAEIRRDPALLAYLDFDDDSGDEVHGARRVQGRYRGNDALEFLDDGDHVRVNLAAVTDTLTMMAWVRLDQVNGGINSIYHTDFWDTPGQVHWMVGQAGQLRLALHGQTPVAETHWPESKHTVIGVQGRWVHVATVYDAKQGSVRFYIDGKLDSNVHIEHALTAVLGPAQIGNWNVKNSRFNDRRLSGRMDELVFLNRVLSDDEIAAFYDAGSPYGRSKQVPE